MNIAIIKIATPKVDATSFHISGWTITITPPISTPRMVNISAKPSFFIIYLF